MNKLNIDQLIRLHSKHKEEINSVTDEILNEKLFEKNILIEKQLSDFKPKNNAELLKKVNFVNDSLRSTDISETDVLNQLILSVLKDVNLLLKSFRE